MANQQDYIQQSRGMIAINIQSCAAGAIFNCDSIGIICTGPRLQAAPAGEGLNEYCFHSGKIFFTIFLYDRFMPFLLDRAA